MKIMKRVYYAKCTFLDFSILSSWMFERKTNAEHVDSVKATWS